MTPVLVAKNDVAPAVEGLDIVVVLSVVGFDAEAIEVVVGKYAFVIVAVE